MTNNKPLIKLYDKLALEQYECLYAIKEDVGITHDLKALEMNFEDIWEFKFDPNSHIVVMSDTHDFERLDEVIKAINFKVDHLIHAGDLGTPKTTMKSLLRFKGEIHAVLGNHDRQYCAAYLPFIKNNPNLHIGYTGEFFTLGMAAFVTIAHENDGLENTYFDVTTNNGMVRLHVFGHTHKPVLYYKRGVSILNPGILCDVGNNKPTFCIYNYRVPSESVFVKNV